MFHASASFYRNLFIADIKRFGVLESSVVCTHRPLNPVFFFHSSTFSWCVFAGLVCAKHHLFCITIPRCEWEAVAIYLYCITVTAAFHLARFFFFCNNSLVPKGAGNINFESTCMKYKAVARSACIRSCIHMHIHTPCAHTDKLPPGTGGINNSHTFPAHLMCSLLWHLRKPEKLSLWDGDLWNHYSPAVTLQPP